MAVLEPIIPQQGGMQQFSYVENFIIDQKAPEDGFRKNKFTLVRRPGTETDDLRVTDGDIVGQEKFDNKIYVWDSLGKIYRYRNNGGNFQFDKIFDNPNNEYLLFTENIFGTTVRQKAIRIPYLSGLSASGTVVSAPNTPGTTPYTLVVSDSIFSAASINKLVYVPTVDAIGALQAGRHQFARIIKYNSATSVDLEFAFLGSELSVLAGNKIEVYDNITNTILFNNIRKTETINSVEITTTVCINDLDELNPEITYRSIYGDDILYLGGKVWTVNNGISISTSISGVLEVVDPLSVLGDIKSIGTRNFQDSILAIEDYQKYILVFFYDSIYVIWENAYDTNSGETIYGFTQAISGMSLFCSTSLGKKNGSLFIMNKDKQMGVLSVTPISEATFTLDFSDQGYIMQDLFDDNILEGDDVFISSDNISTNVIVSKLTETIVYKYYQVYQRWLPQRYQEKINTGMVRFYGYDYYAMGNKFCRGIGEYDLGEDIPQEFSIVGPQIEGMDGRLCYMQQIVMGVGFFNNPIDFDIELELGTDRLRLLVEADASGTEYITWQNIGSGDGSLGTNILGYKTLGGSNVLRDNISKMSILGFRIGRGFTGYFKATVRNKGNANINISLVEFQYIQGNPYLVPVRNVF